MKIDGHAHACGICSNRNKITEYLHKNDLDMILLSAGEQKSEKSYEYSMFSDRFKSENLSYRFNKLIRFVTKLSGVSKYIDEQNLYVYELSNECPDQIMNTYWANPLDEFCLEKLEKFFSNYHFKIIKMHQCWNNFKISDNSFVRVIDWASEYKYPVFIHLLSRSQVKEFIQLTNQYRDTTFIVAHMIGFELIHAGTKNQNVYFDLSAPQIYSEEVLKSAVLKVGSEKLILGSDTPYGTSNIDIVRKGLYKLSLSKEELDNIEGGNLVRLLHLK